MTRRRVVGWMAIVGLSTGLLWAEDGQWFAAGMIGRLAAVVVFAFLLIDLRRVNGRGGPIIPRLLGLIRTLLCVSGYWFLVALESRVDFIPGVSVEDAARRLIALPWLFIAYAGLRLWLALHAEWPRGR